MHHKHVLFCWKLLIQFWNLCPTSQHLVPSCDCQDLPSLPCQMEPQSRFARDRRADEQGMEAIIVENSVGIIRRIHFRTKLLRDGDVETDWCVKHQGYKKIHGKGTLCFVPSHPSKKKWPVDIEKVQQLKGWI